jgi:hypothetical protein
VASGGGVAASAQFRPTFGVIFGVVAVISFILALTVEVVLLSTQPEASESALTQMISWLRV